MAEPFFIFPWQRPFLPDLKTFVDERTGGKPGAALIIVPHQRPWQYFSSLFASSGRPCVLPKMLPFSEVVAIWRAHAAPGARHIASQLEQAAILQQCVRKLGNNDRAIAARLAKMDTEQFLPWGMRLGALLEEMFIHGLQPKDLAHLEHEVAAPAADLLGALGRIGQLWQTWLAENNWTTPGYEHHLAAAGASDIPPFLRPGKNRQIFIAGFYALNGTENRLFHSLWQAGAHICLHTDAKIYGVEPAHHACHEHAAWARRWRASTQAALSPENATSATSPQISFFAGYDCHSQLREMATQLRGDQESTAILLARPDLLMPVVHHLPNKNVNISMGYPLDRTPLANLLEELFLLQETASLESGRPLYHWRQLLKIIRHPYLNMLLAADNLSLRKAFRLMDRSILQGETYVDLENLVQTCLPALEPELSGLLLKCIDILAIRPAKMRSITDLAETLEAMGNFMITHGGDIWSRFPLDAEALAHLRNNVIPALRNCVPLATSQFSMPSLHAIMRQLLEVERVPFEAYPLVGIQLLGMLETRLLHFRRVLVLDATDDILPGTPAPNPLLPDSLRAMLGLPDARKGEQVMAHNLYRICAGADEVRFYWQEGISHSGLFDGKKCRSRFIEQMIWDMEKESGKLLVSGTQPLFSARACIHAQNRTPKKLMCTPQLAAAVDRYLRTSISPTRLDEYLQCPLCFVWKNLLNIAPTQEVNEGEDPPLVGTCLHNTLHDFFSPHLHKTLLAGDLQEEDLMNCFAAQAEALQLREHLPADSWLMLTMAAKIRFAKFLENQPPATSIVALERKLDIGLDLRGRYYRFNGTIDRLDERDGRLVLLDYKTGRLKSCRPELWKDISFLRQLDDFGTGNSRDDGDSLFAKLRERMDSLQMPCYIAMLEASGQGNIGDAALVNLAEDGKEKSIFEKVQTAEIEAAIPLCKSVISFVVAHMATCAGFEACEGDHCRYCAYAKLCMN